MSIALVVIFLVSTIAFCSKPDKPTEEDIAAMVDSLVAFELEKIKSVEQAAPKIDSVAFAKAVADSVAVAVAKKESVFLDMLKECVSNSTLNVSKKPKAPKRQNFYPHYEDDLRACAWWDWEYYDQFEDPYPYPLYGRVRSVCSDDEYNERYLGFNARGDLSSCSIPCGDATDPDTQLYEYNANNDLVGVYVYLYRSWGDPKEFKSPVFEAKKFDSRGNVIEEDIFNGSLMWCMKQGTNKMKYNAKGKIIEKSEFDVEGNKTGKKTWKYNSRGKAIERVEYGAEGNRTGKTTWKYNSKGQVLEKVEYDAEGNETGKSTWKYNSRGDIIEVPASEIDGDYGDGISKITCKYDKRGNRVELAGYDYSDSLVLKKRWYYSKDGILVLAEKYDSTESLEKATLYSYDKRGNVAEIQVYNAAGELKKKRSFKYDRMGNVIEARVSPSSWGREEDVYKYKITYYK